MENTDVVKEDSTNPTGTEPENKEEIVPEETAPAPGSKTDPNLLLASLKDEREKRRVIEEKLRIAEEKLTSSTPADDEVFSDEGKLLLKEIQTLKSELSEIKGNSSKKDVLIDYPILQDKWEEFEEFSLHPDNKGMNIKTAAKAFLVENGLFSAPRKGLEKPTGGDKSPKPLGMTAEDVKTLRETNFRKYTDLLAKGQIPTEFSS